MRNATETELCLVIANSSKKGWIKLVPLGDGTEPFWGDLGASYNVEEVGDMFPHLGLYKLGLQNIAGVGRPPKYHVISAEMVLNFRDLVSKYQ
ncbi:Uncharacterised protein [Streptococcus pneumoniae]|nr:Uncharacterised protein [Streptococcus pneumoniae]